MVPRVCIWNICLRISRCVYIKCMLYACAFPFLFAYTSYIYIHHTYNKKSRVTYTILYNCCCVIITYFNTIYGCSLYRQLSCVHIYIHSVCCCSFVCSLARSLAHTSLYICLHVYCNKRAASECVRTFWQTLNLRQIFFIRINKCGRTKRQFYRNRRRFHRFFFLIRRIIVVGVYVVVLVIIIIFYMVPSDWIIG